MKALKILVVGLALTILATPALGDINASFHLGGGTMRNFGRATGWRFTPTTDILLTKLGLWDEGQDGLAEGHDVGIFDVANPGVALANAFIDSSDPLRGDSRFEAVASVLLSAGTEYYLLANNFTIDRYVFGDGNVGFAPEINWLGFTDGTTNDIFSDPIHLMGLPGDLGPNFQFIMLPQDSDNDGIPDDEDACPNSDLSETIVIENCDDSVGNLLFEDGCTMADLIAECADGAANHGQFVSCVAHLTNDWKRAGLITGEEEGRIQSCAARSDIPGDLDGDGAVGVADLVMLLGAWGPCRAHPHACPADLDLDDIVGITDLLILLGNWG